MFNRDFNHPKYRKEFYHNLFVGGPKLKDCHDNKGMMKFVNELGFADEFPGKQDLNLAKLLSLWIMYVRYLMIGRKPEARNTIIFTATRKLYESLFAFYESHYGYDFVSGHREQAEFFRKINIRLAAAFTEEIDEKALVDYLEDLCLLEAMVDGFSSTRLLAMAKKLMLVYKSLNLNKFDFDVSLVYSAVSVGSLLTKFRSLADQRFQYGKILPALSLGGVSFYFGFPLLSAALGLTGLAYHYVFELKLDPKVRVKLIRNGVQCLEANGKSYRKKSCPDQMMIIKGLENDLAKLYNECALQESGVLAFNPKYFQNILTLKLQRRIDDTTPGTYVKIEKMKQFMLSSALDSRMKLLAPANDEKAENSEAAQNNPVNTPTVEVKSSKPSMRK